MQRRSFDFLIFLAMPALYAGGFLLTALKVLTPFPPRGREPRRDVGPLAELPEGSWRSVDFNGGVVWLQRRGAAEVVALDAKCTHLGCTVDWSDKDGSFICPCHGGRFNADGKATVKPVVQPLRRRKVIVEDGNVILLDEGAA